MIVTAAGAAEVRIRGQSGIFIATECTVAGGVVTAHGRWRHRTGANYAETTLGARETLTWPVRRVDRIKWLTPAR